MLSVSGLPTTLKASIFVLTGALYMHFRNTPSMPDYRANTYFETNFDL
jgi:hypothetical protein